MYSLYYLKSILTNESSNTTTTTSYTYTTSFSSNRIKFWILLVLQLLSIPCFLYVFYRYAHKKQARGTIHHHIIILLLSTSFLFVTVSLSITLAYLYTSQVNPATNTFCTLWNWFHYSINIINLFLMAFASLERNWLIFHQNIVKSAAGKFILHTCPLVFCILYPPLFYAGAMFIHQCTSYYDYTQLLCKWPCYFYNLDWSNIDLFFNNYTPLIGIPVFCSVIYIRIFIQRRHMKQQRFKWRRDKKLVLQLWAMSSLYLAMWMPSQLSALINTYWLPSFLIQPQIDYMYLFPFLIHLIYPYTLLLGLNQETEQSNRHTAAVYPMTQLRTLQIK